MSQCHWARTGMPKAHEQLLQQEHQPPLCRSQLPALLPAPAFAQALPYSCSHARSTHPSPCDGIHPCVLGERPHIKGCDSRPLWLARRPRDELTGRGGDLVVTGTQSTAELPSLPCFSYAVLLQSCFQYCNWMLNCPTDGIY